MVNLEINKCDAKKPKIYKCDHCGKLIESNSIYNDRDGHVCPYCNRGVLHKYELYNRIYTRGNAFSKTFDILSNGNVKYR